MKTIIIIGAMYGDEGKGLMVDYFSSKFLEEFQPEDGAVVRFQGGCQSGHTVVTPDGIRHIHQHFGSGTLLGIPTILTNNFVCNPALFLKEHKELVSKGFKPTVYVEDLCYISTPYDIMLNRLLEDSRGDNRHGSVGVGFGETIERHEVGQVRLYWANIYSSCVRAHLFNKIKDIRDYTMNRAKALGLDASILGDIDPAKVYNDLWDFREIVHPYMRGTPHKFLVFEGGQGLALDMVYGEYPHVTRSRTGLTNAKAFANRYGYPLDKVVYVTRAYTTRHGAGPLEGEMSYSDIPRFKDTTNIYGRYQGSLRVARINSDRIKELISFDSWDFPGEIGIAVTHMDQCPINPVNYPVNALIVSMKLKYISIGPKRTDVVKL